VSVSVCVWERERERERESTRRIDSYLSDIKRKSLLVFSCHRRQGHVYHCLGPGICVFACVCVCVWVCVSVCVCVCVCVCVWRLNVVYWYLIQQPLDKLPGRKLKMQFSWYLQCSMCVCACVRVKICNMRERERERERDNISNLNPKTLNPITKRKCLQRALQRPTSDTF